MARAKTHTLLSLDRWAELMQFNPLHFNGVVLPEQAASDQGWSCGQTVSQYGWQAHGRVGREEIALAIQRAEEDLARELGFDVAPTWHEADSVQLQQSIVNGWANYYTPVRIQLPRGYVLEGGRVAKSLIDTEDVTYSSKYGGEDAAYKETATITVPTDVTDPQEIALYFPGEAGDDAWEIRPIKVSIDTEASTATITCRREQLVKPEYQEDIADWDDVDGTEETPFLDEVEVWRKYNDPSVQLQLVWEPPVALEGPFHIPRTCECTGSGCPLCGYTTQYGCFTVHNRRLGYINLATADWSAEDSTYTSTRQTILRRPDRALVWYRAGYYNPDLARPMFSITRELEQAVFMLSLAYLSRPICGCEGIREQHEFYRTDMSEVSDGISYTAGLQGNDNPFGTRRGCIDAWKKVKSMCLGRGVPVYGR